MTAEPPSAEFASAPLLIPIPPGALVALVGPSGSGKTTFARRHFAPTEILSSDAFRAMVSDDENDQAATPDAFRLLTLALDARLKRRRLTVVDATSLKSEDRVSLTEIARVRHAPLVAIVFELPRTVLEARRTTRVDRRLPAEALDRQLRLTAGLAQALAREGFDPVYRIGSESEAAQARVERPGSPRRSTAEGTPRATDGGRGDALRHGQERRGRAVDDPRRLPGGDAEIGRRWDSGPFDLIGDVHGCADELDELLARLGYVVSEKGEQVRVAAPHGRKAILVGDLVDRGPATPRVLRIAMAMHASESGLAVLGNHDWKLLRWMWGRSVRVSHGLAESIAQLGDEAEPFRLRSRRFLESLPTQLVLDGGRLVVAHAGLTEPLQGQTSRRARDFALYGETTGEIDEFGLPVRINWAKHYRGAAAVVYGHTPVQDPEWLNETIDVDTGCVFGGRLTALRWPERELVSVQAARVYYASARPLLENVDNRDYLGGGPDEEANPVPAAADE